MLSIGTDSSEERDDHLTLEHCRSRRRLERFFSFFFSTIAETFLLFVYRLFVISLFIYLSLIFTCQSFLSGDIVFDEFEKKATNYRVRFGRSLRSAISCQRKGLNIERRTSQEFDSFDLKI